MIVIPMLCSALAITVFEQNVSTNPEFEKIYYGALSKLDTTGMTLGVVYAPKGKNDVGGDIVCKMEQPFDELTKPIKPTDHFDFKKPKLIQGKEVAAYVFVLDPIENSRDFYLTRTKDDGIQMTDKMVTSEVTFANNQLILFSHRYVDVNWCQNQ